MHPCAQMCVCLSACGCTLEQAPCLNISDCFPCLSFSVWLCVLGGCLCKCLGWRVSHLSVIFVCVCVCLRASGVCGVSFLPCPLLPMPCAVSRQHFIRPERPHHVPRPAGSVSPRRISRFGQQHSAPATQTLSLQQQPLFGLHQRGGALRSQPVCSHPR